MGVREKKQSANPFLSAELPGEQDQFGTDSGADVIRLDIQVFQPEALVDVNAARKERPLDFHDREIADNRLVFDGNVDTVRCEVFTRDCQFILPDFKKESG